MNACTILCKEFNYCMCKRKVKPSREKCKNNTLNNQGLRKDQVPTTSSR